MLNRFSIFLLSVSLTLSALSLPAAAQNLFLNPLPVKVCDPANAANCMKPAADGSIAISGGGGGGGAATVADGADVTQGSKADAATCATTNTLLACIRQLDADVKGTGVIIPSTANLTSGVITSAMTGTTSTLLLAAPAASIRNYITQLTCSNSHATVGTNIKIQDGSGGTTFYILPAAAVYGGAAISFVGAPLKQPTTATALYVADETTGASVECAAAGFTGP